MFRHNAHKTFPLKLQNNVPALLNLSQVYEKSAYSIRVSDCTAAIAPASKKGDNQAIFFMFYFALRSPRRFDRHISISFTNPVRGSLSFVFHIEIIYSTIENMLKGQIFGLNAGFKRHKPMHGFHRTVTSYKFCIANLYNFSGVEIVRSPIGCGRHGIHRRRPQKAVADAGQRMQKVVFSCGVDKGYIGIIPHFTRK